MANFEIIVKSDNEALKIVLPEEVVARIKELSSLADAEFKGLTNEKVLDIIVKSLDRLLFGFDHTAPHETKEIETQHGKLTTSKQKK